MYLVAYDLLSDESPEHYSRVIEAIGRCGVAAEVQRSVWLLSSDWAQDRVRNYVGEELYQRDRLLVAHISDASCIALTPQAERLIRSQGWEIS